jgi:hypothetical protein
LGAFITSSFWRFLIILNYRYSQRNKFSRRCKDNTKDNIITEVQKAADHLCVRTRKTMERERQQGRSGALRYLGGDIMVFEDNKGD